MPIWLVFIAFTIFHCFHNFFGSSGGGQRSKNNDFSLFVIIFKTRDALFPPGDEKFSRWKNSAAPSRSLKTQAGFLDCTFLFKLFFKSCDFGPSWGVAHGGDFLWRKIFADWEINYLLHSGVMSEVDIYYGMLKWTYLFFIGFSRFLGRLRDGDISILTGFSRFLGWRGDDAKKL